MHAIRVIEQVFLRRAEKPTGQQARRPAPATQPRHLQRELCDKRGVELFQSGWLVSSTSQATGMDSFTSSSRNFLRSAVVRQTLFHAPMRGFKTGEGDCEFAFKVAGVSQFQFRLALDARIRCWLEEKS